MVYAVWVTKSESNLHGLSKLLIDANEYGLKHVNEIADSEVERLKMGKARCLWYLKESIKYNLGDLEIRGLRLFYDYAWKWEKLMKGLKLNSTMNSVIEKVCSQKRLSFEDGVNLIGSHDLIGLGVAADRICCELHPERYRTYVVDRNINYTNVCTAGCKFCAFYRNKGGKDGYVLPKEEVFRKIEETISLGGTQILMQGGLHPDLKIGYYVDLLRSIKEKFDIHIHSFSPPEIIHFSTLNDMSIKEVLVLLKNAGLDTIPGGGAEILIDRCRELLSPHKCTADEWLLVMREAHMLGMKSTVTMMFGHVETMEERVIHLEKDQAATGPNRGLYRIYTMDISTKEYRLVSID